MSYNNDKEGKVEDINVPVHKIKIALTSTKVKKLETVATNILKTADDLQLYRKGVTRLPTRVLKITTRKTPNGEGSKTWDTYEMRIHKRVIILQAPATAVQKLTKFTIEPGVDIEVTVAKSA